MKRILTGVVIFTVIGFLLYKFFWPRESFSRPFKVEKKNLEIFLTASGKVKANQELNASFLILGQIEMIHSPGVSLRQGDLLARLKTDELWASLQKAYADLNKSNSNFYYYLEVKSETDKTYAWKEDGVSKAKVNQAANNVAIAQDGVEAARFSLDAVRAAYNKAFIKAPFDGVVSRVFFEVGETVSPGQEVLTFIDPQSFFLEAEVDEVDVGYLQVGQTAKVSLDFAPEQEFTATVETIDLSAHQSSAGATVYFVRLKLENKEGMVLRSGLSGEARILKQKKEGVIVLPNAYLGEENGRNFVRIKNNGKNEKRFVEIGELFESGYEIVSGLTEEEVVVSSQKP